MADFNVRSDSVNVEQVMEQIRARIREKRGVDYTEQQIRELAAVKIEKFLDPRAVRGDLLGEFRRASEPDPNYSFEDDTLFRSTRAPFLRWIRQLLRPILKLFFNPNPLIHALHMQSQLNAVNATRHQLYYELIHNLVVETTRLGIEVKNLKMRVESVDARVDFSERRARALEGAVMYRPQADDQRAAAAPPPPPVRPPDRLPSRTSYSPSAPAAVQTTPPSSPAPGGSPAFNAESAGQRSKRRRRRRGRRGGAPAAAIMGSPSGQPAQSAAPVAGAPPAPHGESPSDSGASGEDGGSDDEQ
jgi:hypothetical protein